MAGLCLLFFKHSCNQNVGTLPLEWGWTLLQGCLQLHMKWIFSIFQINLVNCACLLISAHTNGNVLCLLVNLAKKCCRLTPDGLVTPQSPKCHFLYPPGSCQTPDFYREPRVISAPGHLFLQLVPVTETRVGFHQSLVKKGSVMYQLSLTRPHL